MTVPLPEQWTAGCGTLNGHHICRWSEMLAYGDARAAEMKERCAALCDDPPRYNGNDAERAAYCFGCLDRADAIRNMEPK